MASGLGYLIDIWYTRASTREYISNAGVVEIHKLSDVEMETLFKLYIDWKALWADFLAPEYLQSKIDADTTPKI